ncbi:MAG: hypothetical protein JNK92_00575 [Dechloromonas sp.]|nr:hypothetical protein [Dechloromonas sp.]
MLATTVVAHDLCSKLEPYRKQHHLQAAVSHCGVFNGNRWDRQIYPRLRDFIHAFDEQNAAYSSTAKPSFLRTRHHDDRAQGNFDH